ncbi:MAG: hypothetical protein Q8L24_01855 [bacterium]|nr:hypothetical protein [bacterium]
MNFLRSFLQKLNLSEKGGLPNTVRNLLQAGLYIGGGALLVAGHIGWGVFSIILGAALFGVNAAHNFLDNNYLIGYSVGHSEGSRARGLIAPEKDLLEGSYRVLASIPLEEGWVVVVEDINLLGREPRAYKMKEVPYEFFRKERWANPESSDSDAFIYGYCPIQRPV